MPDAADDVVAPRVEAPGRGGDLEPAPRGDAGGQLAFENYRARLNRVFDVGSDELYKPEGLNSMRSAPAP